MDGSKRKVATVVGTRPEIIKLSRVMAELDLYTEHLIVHTGQNYDYELNEIFFNDLGIRKPDRFLDAAGENAAQTVGNVIAKADALFAVEKPDAVLILGDTNSCLAAYPAKRRRIPIFHMEAGNRCFDLRVPEEINRKIIDHISDINMPFTEHARRYLLAEGIPGETIFKTGTPMREVLCYYRSKIDDSDVLQRLGLDRRKYFVVSAHREENVDRQDHMEAILDSLGGLVKEYGFPIIFSTHPRTRKKMESINPAGINPDIKLMKPMGFFDYVKLQMEAFCTVSDSGTITEESSTLNFPAVTIRQAHERPEGVDEGTLIMCGVRKDRVLDAVRVVTGQFDERKRVFKEIGDYTPENVSKKVLRIILSYIDYVNRKVWFKE